MSSLFCCFVNIQNFCLLGDAQEKRGEERRGEEGREEERGEKRREEGWEEEGRGGERRREETSLAQPISVQPSTG
jgi:hypothetical protein